MNHVYNDQDLMDVLAPYHFDQGVVTDGLRTTVKPGRKEGPHNHDQASDLRARFIDTEAKAKKVTVSIVKSLIKGGYELVKAKNGSTTVTELHDNGMPQVWTMFTKDNKTFMLEVDTNPSHIHFQSGTDYDTTRESAKKWPKN